MKPINLKPWEASALLNGATMLLRPCKPQPVSLGGGKWHWDRNGDGKGILFHEPESSYMPGYCPWQPGDVLWCRETWAPSVEAGDRQIAFRADGRWGSPSADGMFYPHGWVVGVATTDKSGTWVGRGYFQAWRSAAQMPRLLSRLSLRVVAVRAVRVDAIAPADAVLCGSRDTRPFRDPLWDCVALQDLREHWQSDHPRLACTEAWAWVVTVERSE